MRAYDIIYKKREGEQLTNDEINYIINGYVNGEIKDYQMSALLMAIFFRGMNDREISTLTEAMINSGDIIDLSSINGIKVDKHSTGGVGDKTTLIVVPIVAHYGVKVAKMSGRGLGHTGGTLDKMEAIPNMKINLSQQEFNKTVNDIGCSIIGQSGKLVLADKLLYALRDVTATVDSIPLIASSIMSKKIASGNDCIVIDVKIGNGAFMKTLEDGIELAKKMVAIGENCGKKTIALITNMDIPLGHNIGNILEIKEVVNTLQGKGSTDLTEISIKLAGNMLYLAQKGSLEQCENMARDAIEKGYAFDKFVQLVEAQGGDTRVIKDLSKFKQAKIIIDIKSEQTGYINAIDTEGIGTASCILGAGRIKKDDIIDHSAGIILNKRYGEFVQKGDTIAHIFTNDKSVIKSAVDKITKSILIKDSIALKINLIIARIEKNSLKIY